MNTLRKIQVWLSLSTPNSSCNPSCRGRLLLSIPLTSKWPAFFPLNILKPRCAQAHLLLEFNICQKFLWLTEQIIHSLPKGGDVEENQPLFLALYCTNFPLWVRMPARGHWATTALLVIQRGRKLQLEPIGSRWGMLLNTLQNTASPSPEHQRHRGWEDFLWWKSLPLVPPMEKLRFLLRGEGEETERAEGRRKVKWLLAAMTQRIIRRVCTAGLTTQEHLVHLLPSGWNSSPSRYCTPSNTQPEKQRKVQN